MSLNDSHNNIWFFRIDNFSKSWFQFILFIDTYIITTFIWLMISNVKKSTTCSSFGWSKFIRIVIQIQAIYSQTCSNHHLYIMTTCLRPILSLPKPIPIQSLLHKTTTCLMQSATTFFVPKWKKNCLKPLQNFIH